MRFRPRQSRGASFLEAAANVVVGFLLALIIQRLAYLLFGFDTTLAADSAIAAIFTLVSLGRSYAIRRIFERLTRTA